MSQENQSPSTSAKNAKSSSLPHLTLGAILVVVGFYFYYATSNQFADIVRILIVLASAILGLVVVSFSSVGKSGLNYVAGVRQEVRKVVWPSRQETMQMTLIVLVMVFLVGLFLWGIDSLFLWLVELIV